MKIAVVLEDYRHDQYIVKAILDKMKRQTGINFSYRIVMDPMIGGIEKMKDRENIRSVCLKYGPMTDLIIFIHDRDGRNDRDMVCGSILSHTGVHRTKVRCVAAHQEIEAWGLAGVSDLPKNWSWPMIRAEGSVKEVYFEAYTKLHNLEKTAGRGRVGVAQKISYKRVISRCPEVKDLETEIIAAGV